VDAELRQYLVEMEERIVSSLKSRFDDLNSHVDDLKSYVDERCERVETSLLTEFHKWASPAEARNRTISAALRSIDIEMEALTDRVKKLEGRTPHQ
jgi:chromosome condensin MukBEF ATPase and DNA-binding subunit MukB